MDWNNLKAQYPRAYRKFWEWFRPPVNEDTVILNRVIEIHHRCLFDFFDKSGIMVRISYECTWISSSNQHTYKWFYHIKDDGSDNALQGCNFDSRIESEKDAFLKAFILLDNQLHK